MERFADIDKQSDGAKFFRGDLHVHSFGGSHDVVDETMTPENIVATAIDQNLDLIAIADHNEIKNVERAIKAASGTDLMVIPAIELSTPNGHLLCYFESVDALQKFHARLTLRDRDTDKSRCDESMIECLNKCLELNGFGIFAHVDGPKGFDTDNPKPTQHNKDVVLHKALLGMEIRSAASSISYSDHDPNPHRRKTGEERILALGLGAKQYLARVLNSDAHKLVDLGHNAEHNRRLTRFKMDDPSFRALRIALEDADARVRIEDLIPPSVPQIVGIKLEGGFLSNQSIRFSPNLNCIVGGRGTGKSMTFEAVRCLINDSEKRSDIVDSDVWPEQLLMIWKDKAGARHHITRQRHGDLENIDDSDLGPTSFEIDCFGQGDAKTISDDAKKNPLALLNYLDRFIAISDALEEERDSRTALRALQKNIVEAEANVERIPDATRQLATTKEQLEALSSPEVKSLIELQRKLASEAALRNEIQQLVAEAKQQSDSLPSHSAADQIVTMSITESVSVGAEEFEAISDAAATLEKQTLGLLTAVKTALTAFSSVVDTQVASWKAKDAQELLKIDAKRKEIEELKIPFDLSYSSKLAKTEASQATTLKNLKTWVPHLEDLRLKKAKALQRRWDARQRVLNLRIGFARSASDTLESTLSDLSVSLKYRENAFSPEAEKLINETMGWVTNQQVRSAALVEELTVPALLKAIKAKDAKPLTSLLTPEFVPIFKAPEAAKILERLGETDVRDKLECVEIHDLPRLLVTKLVVDSKGKTVNRTKEFARLSLGQQQSVLLALMLSADTDKPLIIDQPEDNLDGEFIYATLVPVLRRAKERRQIIIVTHNANVAVLGDAELIVVMRAMNDQGSIATRGSIDQVETRDAACGILEGAREAFTRRATMYGLSA